MQAREIANETERSRAYLRNFSVRLVPSAFDFLFHHPFPSTLSLLDSHFSFSPFFSSTHSLRFFSPFASFFFFLLSLLFLLSSLLTRLSFSLNLTRFSASFHPSSLRGTSIVRLRRNCLLQLLLPYELLWSSSSRPNKSTLSPSSLFFVFRCYLAIVSFSLPPSLGTLKLVRLRGGGPSSVLPRESSSPFERYKPRVILSF